MTSNLSLTQLFFVVLGDMPYRVVNLVKRHEYILRSTVEKFKKVSNKEPENREDLEEEKEIQK